MGFWDTMKGVGRVGLGLATGGLSEVAMNEDLRSKIPLLGPLTGAESDEQKQLQAKQEQLAREAQQRRQQAVQSRMNALGQSVLAFNPRNQMMAQMFGPEAAFTPSQFAQMVQNPVVPAQPWGTGTDTQRRQQVRDRDAEQRRQQMVMQGIQQPAPGPAPLQMRPPAPARRY